MSSHWGKGVSSEPSLSPVAHLCVSWYVRVGKRVIFYLDYLLVDFHIFEYRQGVLCFRYSL